MTKILPFTVRGPTEYDCFCGANNPSEHIFVKEPGNRTVCSVIYAFGSISYRTCIEKPPEDLCTEEDMKDIST